MSVTPTTRSKFSLTQLRGRRSPNLAGLFAQSLPVIALVVIFVVCAVLQPRILTLDGLALLLSPAVPLMLAAMSQMFIIMLGDIDLGNGALIGLVTAVTAVFMADTPLLAVLILVGVAIVYVAQAVLVQVRGIPSIIVTLGASFIWLGIGLAILPFPGGVAPQWLSSLMNLSVPQTDTVEFPIPMAVLFGLVIGAAGYWLTIKRPYGVVLRAAGSNPSALRRAGWSVLRVRMIGYGCAAVFAILAGIALSGQISAGDVTTTANYTLLTIAAVILGGAQFSGGRAVPFGAVIGATALSLVTSMLSFLDVPSSYQTGVQGLILVVVLAGRVLTDRSDS